VIGGMEYRNPRRAANALLVAAVVALALVLAFLVGRFSGSVPDHTTFHSRPDAEQGASQAFEKGAEDGIWTDVDEFALKGSLAGVDQEGQLRLLGRFAAAVNSGKLKLAAQEGRPPPPRRCCTVCNPGEGEPDGYQGAAPAKKN
jgi:hypothetical protein